MNRIKKDIETIFQHLNIQYDPVNLQFKFWDKFYPLIFTFKQIDFSLMQTFLFMRLKQSFLLTFVLINFTIYTVRAIYVMSFRNNVRIGHCMELR